MTERLRDVKTQAEWDRVLSAAAFVQSIVPDAILVGGSASALYSEHRFSADDDHVVQNLKDRFAQILHDIESAAGWSTSRVQPPVLILGSFNGVDTGIRNLIRSAPLETTTIDSPAGRITVPTLPEMFRIKAWLIISRNMTRDYVDTIALSDRLGEEGTMHAMHSFDALYPQPHVTATQQLIKQLAEPLPADPDIDLQIYKSLREPYMHYQYILERCADLSSRIFRYDREAGRARGVTASRRLRSRDR